LHNSDDVTVFYSWQSDLDASTTRNLIRKAIQRAVRTVSSGVAVADSPRLDQDTKGIAGTPAITQTIFHKIESSAVFVADVTIVCRHSAPQREEKGFPNPNVMLELGYAAATIGWDRIILVMNAEFGNPQLLPFDLRNRRFPLQFHASNGNDERLLARMAESLEEAISVCLAQSYQAAHDVVARLDTGCLAILKRHAGNSAFWEEVQEGHDPLGQLFGVTHAAIRRLLEMKVIRSFEYDNAHGFAYRWTYLGREVLKLLGYSNRIAVNGLGTALSPPVVVQTFSDIDVAARLQLRLPEGDSPSI
jgi:hypothetical protein